MTSSSAASPLADGSAISLEKIVKRIRLMMGD